MQRPQAARLSNDMWIKASGKDTSSVPRPPFCSGSAGMREDAKGHRRNRNHRDCDRGCHSEDKVTPKESEKQSSYLH